MTTPRRYPPGARRPRPPPGGPDGPDGGRAGAAEPGGDPPELRRRRGLRGARGLAGRAAQDLAAGLGRHPQVGAGRTSTARSPTPSATSRERGFRVLAAHPAPGAAPLPRRRLHPPHRLLLGTEETGRHRRRPPPRPTAGWRSRWPGWGPRSTSRWPPPSSSSRRSASARRPASTPAPRLDPESLRQHPLRVDLPGTRRPLPAQEGRPTRPSDRTARSWGEIRAVRALSAPRASHTAREISAIAWSATFSSTIAGGEDDQHVGLSRRAGRRSRRRGGRR